MIPQAKIDEIIYAANIEQVIGDYVRLKRRGSNLTGLCPFHTEKSPSFSVSPAKGIFKCFGCGKAGNVVNFIMEHDSLGYVPALKFLAEKFNLEWPQQEYVNVDEEKKQRDEKESLQILNNWANDYFQDILLNNEIGQAIGLSYFENRGFRNDTIKKFNLGYSLDSWSAFFDKAIANQFSEDLLFSSGLVKHKEDGKKFDAYRGRVIFPIHNLNGKVIAFAGRYLKKEPNSPKYVNSPETLLYHKSNELYGLYYGKNEIRKQDAVYLVEGYTDVISMHQSGVENVVASSGTSLTEGQIRLIKRFTENVTVLFDGDAAGIKASIRGIDMLLEQGLNVRVLTFPDGDDPDSYSQKVGSDAFKNYLETHDARVRNEAVNIINGRAVFGGDDGTPNQKLIDFYAANRRRIDVGAVTAAIDVIGSYEGDDPLSMEQQQELIGQSFEKLLPQGGRRTRRVRSASSSGRHRVSTKRRHPRATIRR